MPLPHRNAYIVTGPTSGIGLCAALKLSAFGTVILAGRDRRKLETVQKQIAQSGGQALPVLCDFSDLESVQRAAAEIAALNMPIAGLLNNAGVMLTGEGKTAQGWDLTFTTNHLGPFALTQALVPHLPHGANIVFVVSAVEDPGRSTVKAMGMRGGRYISVEASARGEWLRPGTRFPGMDAYATSKQCELACAMALSRELPGLRINAVEPGINPSTGLGGAGGFMRVLFAQVITRLPPFSRYRTTPERAAEVIARILTDTSCGTGIYFSEKGQPMEGSLFARDPRMQDRVLAETRAFLTAHGH